MSTSYEPGDRHDAGPVTGIRVRYFGGTRAAAGTSEEDHPASTLAELLDRMGEAHGPRLRAALRTCSFLVNGTQWRDRHAVLPSPATVDVLPPFAGG
ncbi:MoaD/ThiS family protein [Micromonospora sp. NPDC048930]|uniref:MoaD/ThiS family protein n=1 Tax=Micromonospora sp. NPDC048930 TaxID=3364261 RepID=UPI003723E9F6